MNELSSKLEVHRCLLCHDAPCKKIYKNIDPETVLLIDKWKDEESLDIHHKTPMMKEIAKLRE